MRRQNYWLTAWLIGPLAALTLIMWAVVISLRHPPTKMQAVGAGAGDTGTNNSAFRVFGAAHTAAEPGSPAPGSPAAEPPTLVQPESLPQGFVIIVEDKSGRASPDSPIYVAGSFNNWNPGDAAFKLSAQSDMRWRIQIPAPIDGKPIEFKFTRGTWELEELAPDMSKVKNRTLAPIDASKLAQGEQPKLEFVVPHWGDELPEYAAARATDPYRAIEVTGTVRRVQVSGGAGDASGRERELLVWLPPGYDAPENAAKRYPVLYMHDGQNLFAAHPGVPAEWGLDETATALLEKSRATPFIIVGIPHSGAGRMSEYLPGAFIPGVEPQGAVHVRWLRSDVMPRIERAFRVATGPENTGVGGSSLGAAISVLAAADAPDVFGLLYLESLSFGASNDGWTAILDRWQSVPSRVFIGVGGREAGDKEETNRRMVSNTRELEAMLKKKGLGADRLMVQVDEAAEHNEKAWAARAPAALKFLFPTAVDTTK
ncbi:MAG: alpha/beta hydrolase-fold protein [Phycisphaerales bacterium]